MTTQTAAEPASSDEKIECLECGKRFHRLDVHLGVHRLSPAEYSAKHPGAQMVSKRALDAMRSRGEKLPEVPRTDQDVIRCGAAQMRMRHNLSQHDENFLPRHDEQYEVNGVVKERWESLMVALQEREPALVVGPTGAGKSTSVLELACILNQPVRRVNLHGDVRAADFVGSKTIDVDPATGQAVVVWRDGILPQALRAGHWLLLDEIDAAPPQILFVLQMLLEKDGVLVLMDHEGEVVAPHEHFRLIATANTLGRGDDSGLYAGTNVLNEAFLDRFGVVLDVGYLDPEAEKAILVAKGGVTEADASRMIEVARKVREATAKLEIHCTMSTRRLIGWARKAVILKSAHRAARISILNKLGGDDRKFVADTIQRVFGGVIS